MNVLERARAQLEQADYATMRPSEAHEIFHFEDPNVLGYVAVHPSVEALIADWEGMQEDFLAESASRIRDDPQKAWNVYSVHLTEGVATAEETSELKRIEEDLRATRKIIVPGIRTRSDIKAGLLPLLPLQNLLPLSKRGDLARLRDRIAPNGGPLAELAGDIPPSEIADLLSASE